MHKSNYTYVCLIICYYFIIIIHVRASRFGAISALLAILAWTNVIFILFYNIEFRSSTIEPYTEVLPTSLAQVDLKKDTIITFGSAYLNPVDNILQEMKTLKLVQKIRKKTFDWQYELLNLLLSKICSLFVIMFVPL